MSDTAPRSAAEAGESKVKCPKCSKWTTFKPSNPCRPFCSNRCRESDLAAWASDTYQIQGPDQHLQNNQGQYSEEQHL